MTTPSSNEQAATLMEQILYEVKRVVVGQDHFLERVMVALLAQGHLLVEGVPGLAKTLTVKTLALTLRGSFKRIQFTPDLVPADLVGTRIFNPRTGEFSTSLGPVFTHLLLADEINRAPAKTQSALLEAMQERQVTIEGESHPLAPPFMVLATQNPLENEGTYPLPEAQLDRFLVKVRIAYPSEQEEQDMLAAVTRNRVGDGLDVAAVATLVRPDTIVALQQLTARIRVDDSVANYAVRLVRATRDWAGIAIGAGPRGSIALVRLARAMALLAGRDYVTPDDIKQAALPVLRHRIAMSPDSELDGLNADQLLSALVQQIAAPRA